MARNPIHTNKTKPPTEMASTSHNTNTKATEWNGEEYWKAWAEAGGTIDDYIIDTATNFALVAALMITFTWPSCTDPPDDLENPVPFVGIQLLATGMFFFIICACVFVIKDIRANTSTEAKLRYCHKFGYLIFTVNPMLLILANILLISSLFYQISDMYDGSIVLYCCATFCLLVVMVVVPVLYLYMVYWNFKYAYGPDIEALKNKKEKEEATRALR